MQILIRKAHIIDSSSPHHGRKLDIRVAEGRITEIGLLDQSGDERVLEAEELYASPGWFDMRVSLCDPGFEHREDLFSGADVAASGGFTGMACLPDTSPVIQSKAEVEYVLNKSSRLPVDIRPYGALTQDLEGKEITEMYDMHRAGAIGFSNANHSIMSSGALQRALLYTRGFNGLVCLHAEDTGITKGAQMHEGVTGTLLGLKGFPGHAEFMQLQRDIEVLEYTGGRIHFSHISTARSVEIIRRAKERGLNVTCDVAVHNLIFTDQVLEDYNTNYKVNPPLREASDIEALKKGLLDDTVDAIVSDHSPWEIECKDVEFDYAAFGMIGLQSFYSALLLAFDGKIEERIMQKFVKNPRKILGIPVPKIEVGEECNLSLFNPGQNREYNKTTNRSRSANSPFFGTTLRGKVFGIVNNLHVIWNP